MTVDFSKRFILSERAPGEVMPWEVGSADTREELIKLMWAIKDAKKGNFMADKLEYFIRENTPEGTGV